MNTLTTAAAVVGLTLVLGAQFADARSDTSEAPAPVPSVAAHASDGLSTNAVGNAAATDNASASEDGDVPVVAEATLTEVVAQYCTVCHNDALLTGNISLTGFDVEAAPEEAETAERMIRKLRAGMMPPPGMPRPGGDTLSGACGDPREEDRPCCRAQPQSRRPDLPAPEPRRVRAVDP